VKFPGTSLMVKRLFFKQSTCMHAMQKGEAAPPLP